MGSQAARAIDDLRALPDNWDSYGAPRIARAACLHAEQLVVALQNALGARFVEPVVGPDVGGGVELLWESPPHESAVHVYVPPSGASTVVVLQKAHLERRFAPRSPAEIVDALNTFRILR